MGFLVQVTVKSPHNVAQPLYFMRGITIHKELNPGVREPDELSYSHLLNESWVYLLPYYIDNNKSNQICDP